MGSDINRSQFSQPITSTSTTASDIFSSTISAPTQTGEPLQTTSSITASYTPTESVNISSVPADAQGGSRGSDSQIGAIAGGTVGGVVFGVIVGVLIMLLLNRKRPRRRSRKIYEKSPMSHFKDDEVAVDGTGTHSGPAFAKWQIHLPQPVDDQSIGQQFKTLLHQIELHVENFYTGSGVSNLPDASRTAIDSYDSGLLPSSLSTLLTTDHDVRPFIKHSLTYSVTRQIDVKAPVRSKLLPREVTTLPFLLSHQSRDGRHTDRKVLNEAYSMWRVLTAYLRPQDENNAQSPSSAKAVTEIAQHFSRTFAPWADSRKLVQAEDIRATNLIDILDFAVEVGMLLFSQPSQMEMKWVSADRKRPTAAITTAPALYKTTDQQGKALVQPQLLVESTMM